MKKKRANKSDNRFLFEELEPRVLLSADWEGAFVDPSALRDEDPAQSVIITESAEALSDSIETSDSQVSQSEIETIRRELVFVDTGTPDYQQLVDDILNNRKDGVQIDFFLLDSGSDGIAQISEILPRYEDIDAIHIVSHGSDGNVNLGGSTLNADNLTDYQNAIRGWSNALDADADILIYGCNLAATNGGQALIDSLGSLTGADIAASTDLTGNVSLGGDWNLEYTTGTVEATVAFSAEAQASWGGLLSETTYTSYESAPDVGEIKSDTNSGQTFSYNSGKGTYNVNQLSLLLSRDNDTTAQNITVSLRTSWNGPDLASASISSSSLSTSMNWETFDIGDVSLDDSTTYYIRVTSDSADGKVWIGFDSSGSYSNGDKIDVNGSPLGGEDLAFRVAELITTGGTIADNFDDGAGGDTGYSGNDGTQNWTGDWQESGEANGSSSGVLRVDGGRLRLGHTDIEDQLNPALTREADLSGATSATLSYDFQTVNHDNNGPVTAQVSGDGGSTWRTLATYSATNSTGSESFDITGEIASNTQVRFQLGAKFSMYLYVDNVQIEYATGPKNNVPGPQSSNEDTALVFNDTNLNKISISDAYAGTEPLEVTLTVNDGILDLSGISGLNFISGSDSSATMTFTGTLTNINAALDGLTFTPDSNFNGSASLQITTHDDTTLQGHYSFDLSGDLGNDSSPAGINDGVVNGATPPAVPDPAPRDNALEFAGNDNVQISGHFGDPADVTLAAWVNPTAYDTNGSDFISLGDSVALRYESFSSLLTGFYFNGSVWQEVQFSTNLLTPDSWHHVAYTVDDTNNLHTLYLDGVAVNSDTMTGSVAYTLGANTFIGTHGNGDTPWDFIGQIDDARIYDRALTNQEISGLANDLLVNTDTDTVAITVNPVNDAPVADLNGSDDVGVDYSTTFIEGSPRINITDTDATVTDPDNTTYQSLGINLGGFVDGSDEEIRVDNEQFDYGVSDVIVTTVGSTDFNIDFDGTSFTITRDGGGTIPEADLQTLLRSITYENKSLNPTIGNRTFDIIPQDAGLLNATPSVSTVSVSAVNDAPVLDPIGNQSIDELATLTFTASATDADLPANGLTYSLDATSQAAGMSIDANTGAFAWTPTEGQDGSHSVTVTVTDDGAGTLSDSETFSITVTPVNNNAPVITSPNTANVAENTTAVHQVTLTDADLPGDSFTYSINTTGADDALFQIDASGNLSFIAAPDYESPSDANGDNDYIVDVAVNDGVNTSVQTITVTVTDQTEVVSFSVDAIANTSVAENSVFTSVTPNLSGATPIGNVTYTLGGTDAGLFTVDSASGVVSMVARNFESPADANTDNVYEVTLIATDDDGNTDNEAFTVSVTDQTEVVSFTVDAIANTTVAENSAFTSVTPNLSGATPIGNVTYTLGGTDAGLFTVDSASGLVSMVARNFESPADADGDNVYEVSLVATDDDGNTDSEAFTVSVTDQTEVVSFTVDAIANTSVAENTGFTSVTPNLSGTTPIGNVTYTLGGTDAGLFAVDSASGVVSMVARNFEAPADANTDNIYEVTLIATDADGNTDNEAFTVSVTDQTEVVSFTVDAIANTSVAENTGFTSVTPNLSGTTPIGNVTYTLGGTDAGLFTVDSASGVVSMVARNFEAPADANTDNIYEVTLIATDDDSNTDFEAFTVSVTDQTEVVSFTVDAITNTSVAENAAFTSVTPSLSGATPIGNVTYTLGGTDAGLFTVDSASGVVSMVARNFEAPADNDGDNVYEVTLVATDDDSNTDAEAFTVSVTDQTEVVSFTVDAIANTSVAENAAFTSVTPSLSGATPIGNVTYTLGGTDAGLFTLDSASGVVSMVARNFEAPADANTDNIYEVTLIATDDDGNTDNEAFTVSVTDQTEVVSFTVDAITNTTVAENTGFTSVTPNLSGATPIGNVTYTLGGTDAGLFTVDSASGVVSMVARDFETPADNDGDNVYEVTLIATDDDGNTDNEAFTVSVTDQTEVVSFSVDAITNTTVAENTGFTSVTPTLSGATPIGNVTYTLGATDAGLFTVDSASGVVSMVARNFEAPADANTDNIYEVTLIATDDDGNTDNEAFTVSVTDQTEVVSFSVDAIANTSVAENSVFTSVTPNLSGATPIGNVTYTLGGTDAGLFTVDSASGVVSMVARNFESPADANTDNVYEVTLIATDDDGNTDNEAFTVSVTDQTEVVSFTVDAIANTTVAENSAFTSVTPNLSGATPIGNVTYTLGGTDAGLFTVDSASGVVSMVARDFETPADNDGDNVYEVTLVATDDDGNTDSEAFTVSVTDQTEVVSFSVDAIANTSVAENTGFTSLTPNLSGATPIGNVTYTLGGTDAGLFTVDNASGVVSMVARNFESPADADGDNVYEVSLVATDDDSNTDAEAFTVSVTDQTEVANFTVDAISNTTVAENTAFTSVTPNLSGATPIGNVTYTLGGTDAGLFTVDNASGVVSMVARNFEAPADANTDNIYEVMLIATDDDGNTDSEAFTVSVTDQTEVVSFTVDAITNTTVAENSAFTSVTPNLSGATPIGNVTYTLGGTDAGLFTVDSASGVVSMVARNFEAPADANTDNIYEVSLIATDDDGNTDNEAFTVTVTNANETPTALDDKYDLTKNSSLSVFQDGVLGNDSDQEMDPLSAVLVDGPGNGTLQFNSDGSFSYTPDADFQGSDSFTYKTSDGSLESNIATVNLGVNPEINSDRTVDYEFTVARNEPLSIDVIEYLVNDGIVTRSRISSGSFTQPDNGNVVQNSDATLTFTNDTDFVGTDNFIYTLIDQNGVKTNANIFVIVVTGDDEVNIAASVNTPNVNGQQSPEEQLPLISSEFTESGEDDEKVTEVRVSTSTPRELRSGHHGSVEEGPPEEQSDDAGGSAQVNPQPIEQQPVVDQSADGPTTPDLPVTPDDLMNLAANLTDFDQTDSKNFDVADAVLANETFWNQVDLMKQQMDDANDRKLMHNVVLGTTFTLSAGFVSWVMRGGSLLASLLSTMPIWTNLDPLPILSAGKKKPGDSTLNKMTDPDEPESRADDLFATEPNTESSGSEE